MSRFKKPSLRFLPVAVLACVLSLLLTPVTAGAAGTLDQHLEGPLGTPCGEIGRNGLIEAQTFTAGLSGTLSQIDVHLGRYFLSNLSDPVTVEIQTVNLAGAPSGTVIGRGAILSSQVPQYTDAAWISVPLMMTGPSVAGTQYALVLSAAPVSGNVGTYCWSTPSAQTPPNPDFYPGGMRWYQIRFDNAGTPLPLVWQNDLPDTVDFAFRTYVMPAPISKEQCKDNGWQIFDTMFKNQGECVAYVNHH